MTIEQKKDISSRQAAIFLGMPELFFDRLLDEGKVPYFKVNNSRFINYADFIQLQKIRSEQNLAIQALINQSQKLQLK